MILLDGFEEYDLYKIGGTLLEAKDIGTHAMTDDVRQTVIDIGFDLNEGQWRLQRRRATKSANKNFKELQDRLRTAYTHYTNNYIRGNISFTRWERWVKHLLKEAYYETFDLGLKSSGASAYGVGRSDIDNRWIRSAHREEVKHFNKLLRKIRGSLETPTYKKAYTDTDYTDPNTRELKIAKAGEFYPVTPTTISDRGKRDISDRVLNYIDSLKHVFYAGRVMGTPEGTVIDWISPLDRNTCNGCRFLSNKSPYTRETLPTTPRAGSTRCLQNCRCRLVIRQVSPAETSKTRAKHRSRRWYMDKLNRLKAGKTL